MTASVPLRDRPGFGRRYTGNEERNIVRRLPTLDLRLPFLSFPSKKLLNYRRTIGGQNTPCNFDAVV